MNLATETLQLIVLLLVLASLVAVVVQRVPIPYTVVLVLVGIALDAVGLVPVTALSPALVLPVLLPPLLFEAAFALRWDHLRSVAPAIAVLATVGVVVSSLVTAALLVLAAGLPWSIAVLFGALVAATDPVAVVAFFQRARVAPELRALIEGESLLNDGTAVVLVGILGGSIGLGQVDIPSMMLDFLRIGGGGIIVGGVVGLAGSALARGTNDYLVEATVSLAAAYGSYLLGDHLQVSGVLAVVAAGSVLGNFGRRFGLSARTDEAIDLLWRFLAFVANSLVFLLLGAAVDPAEFIRLGPLIAFGIGATWLGRAVTAYGLGTVLGLLDGTTRLAWRHVLFWGGLRGALPVVVAISLTDQLSLPPLLRDLVLDVVILTLLIQGVSLESVLARALRSSRPRGNSDSG